MNVLLRSVAHRVSSIRNFFSYPSTTNESAVNKLGVVHFTSLFAGFGAASWVWGDYPKQRDEQRREAWIKEHGDDSEFKALRHEIWLRKLFKIYD